MWDEFGQVRDVATGTASEIIEVLKAVNMFEWDLHMDKLEEKGNRKFGAKFCLLTTNLKDFTNIESIIEVKALERRFHLRFIVTPHEDYMTEESKGLDLWKREFDFSKLPNATRPKTTAPRYPTSKPLKNFNPDYQSYWEVLPNGYSQPLTFDELIRRAMELYQMKKDQHVLSRERLTAQSKLYRDLYKADEDEPILMEEVPDFGRTIPQMIAEDPDEVAMEIRERHKRELDNNRFPPYINTDVDKEPHFRDVW